jgi:hypothetical protein
MLKNTIAVGVDVHINSIDIAVSRMEYEIEWYGFMGANGSSLPPCLCLQEEVQPWRCYPL